MFRTVDGPRKNGDSRERTLNGVLLL